MCHQYNIESSHMANLGQKQKLEQALAGLYNSSLAIYEEFQVAFKIVGLIVLACLCFKMGKYSVSQPLASKSNKLRRQISKLEQERVEIPKTIESISKSYKKVIVISVLALIVIVGLMLSEKMEVSPVHISIISIIPLFVYIIMIARRSSLEKKIKSFPEAEKKLREKTREIIKLMGPKVQQNLKATLCRDKILKKQKEPANQCSKKLCQDTRIVLRKRYEAIKELAESALNFDWCSICKRKPIFDELVKFEFKGMEKKEHKSEEQQVEAKIQFLLESLEEMSAWIQHASPCNCSKIYMDSVIRNKKFFNQVKKETDEKLLSLSAMVPKEKKGA